MSNDDLLTGAETISRWEYRSATINWYLPSLIRCPPDDLELTVVHEYCHILLAPLECHMKKSGEGEVSEFTTESVARAILKAHRDWDGR
jgi:hypothetical protein